MKLIIKVVDEIRHELNQKEYTSETSQKLLSTLKQNNAALKLLYSNLESNMLQTYFTVDANSEQTATRILNELWKSGAITSGCIKPKDEPPL